MITSSAFEFDKLFWRQREHVPVHSFLILSQTLFKKVLCKSEKYINHLEEGNGNLSYSEGLEKFIGFSAKRLRTYELIQYS